MTEKIRDISVIVRRDSFGVVYSEIINRAEIDYRGEVSSGIVIDRQKGRGIDSNTVIRRAQSLANLLGAPYDEDLTWPCVAIKKLACRCPECIKTGRA